MSIPTTVRPRIIAHRGASGEFPEQTRSAYVQAIAQGADGLECDVQLTRDGFVVCWHDWGLARTSNGSGRLDEHSLAELRALDVSSWKSAAPPSTPPAPQPQPATPPAAPPPSFPPPPTDRILTLAELWAIAVGAGRPIELVIETKQPSPAGADLDRRALGVLRAGGWDPGRRSAVTVTLMSFDPRSVARLSGEVGPSRTCQLITTEDDLARDSAFAGLAHAACVGARAAIDSGVAGIVGPSLLLCREEPDTVRGWVEAGLTVRVWTVNTADDARYLLDLGVTELTTDYPAALRAALAGR